MPGHIPVYRQDGLSNADDSVDLFRLLTSSLKHQPTHLFSGSLSFKAAACHHLEHHRINLARYMADGYITSRAFGTRGCLNKQIAHIHA